MMELIEESKYQRLDKDPLNSMKTQVSKVLKEYGNVICENPT